MPSILFLTLVIAGCSLFSAPKRTANVFIYVNSIEKSAEAIKIALPDFKFTLIKDLGVTANMSNSIVVGVPFKKNEGYAQVTKVETLFRAQATDKLVYGAKTLYEAIDIQEKDNLVEVILHLTDVKALNTTGR